MPALTPSFVMDFESRMQLLSEQEHLRLLADENRWWDKVTKIRPSGSKRELVSWVLNTAYLVDQGQGGNIDFEDPVMLETEWTNKTSGKGIRLRRQQFEDLDGNGVDLATEWASQMGAQFGYWPQRQVASLLKNGETNTTYDGKAFFATNHFTNGQDTSNGTFSNLLAGATYRIDSAETMDDAAKALAAVYKAIRSIKMPNGKDPRMLRPAGILCGPALFPRASQLLDAKFIAGASGGTNDFLAYASRLGFGRVTEAPELVDAEYDTSYFVIIEQLGTSQMGAFLYVEREPFSIRYYTGRGGGTGVSAELDRLDMLEWHGSGRNVAGYGHPFLCVKVKAA